MSFFVLLAAAVIVMLVIIVITFLGSSRSPGSTLHSSDDELTGSRSGLAGSSVLHSSSAANDAGNWYGSQAHADNYSADTDRNSSGSESAGFDSSNYNDSSSDSSSSGGGSSDGGGSSSDF